MRFLKTSLITLVGTIVPTFADECADICTVIPNSCSHKGSYCKNGHACMDLFWSIEEREICNQSIGGCENKKALLCSDATRIVQTRNSARIAVMGGQAAAPARAARADVPTPSPPAAADRWSGSGMKRMSAFPGTDEIQSSLFGSYVQAFVHNPNFHKALLGPHTPHYPFAHSVWEATCRFLDLLFDDHNRSNIVDSRRFMQRIYWDRWMWHSPVNSERFREYIASSESIDDWHDDLEKVLGPNHLAGTISGPRGSDSVFSLDIGGGPNFDESFRSALFRKVGPQVRFSRVPEMMVLYPRNLDGRAPLLFSLEAFGSISYAPGQAEGSWLGLCGIVRHGNGQNKYKVQYLDHAVPTWVSIDGNAIEPIREEPERSSEGVFAYIYFRLT